MLTSAKALLSMDNESESTDEVSLRGKLETYLILILLKKN